MLRLSIISSSFLFRSSSTNGNNNFLFVSFRPYCKSGFINILRIKFLFLLNHCFNFIANTIVIEDSKKTHNFFKFVMCFILYFRYFYNKYSIHKRIKDVGIYITTNYRVLVENNWLDDLKYICEPTEHHEKRITVKFITDQGILREFTRHRVFSFAVESTRQWRH